MRLCSNENVIKFNPVLASKGIVPFSQDICIHSTVCSQH